MRPPPNPDETHEVMALFGRSWARAPTAAGALKALRRLEQIRKPDLVRYQIVPKGAVMAGRQITWPTGTGHGEKCPRCTF